MYLCSLDPLNWKEQDHYRLLGLSDLHQNATLNDIKKAYHKAVLVYHPDKRQQRQGDKTPIQEEDSNVFKCIQKAYEVLIDPQQRHAFDSVDPKFVESILGPLSQKKLDSDPFLFYKTFTLVFESNARFSKHHPVPRLGNPSTSRKDVENFYSFWYNFESTRSFEYLDEEDQHQADNRYDKRCIEKKNKAARLKRKTEDNIRLRKLVDAAVQSDPRLKLFKEQDRKAKEEQKQLKEAILKANLSAAKNKSKSPGTSTENDRFKAKQADDAEKARLMEIKRQVEAERSELKRLRKEIRSRIKEYSFFTPASDINMLEKRIAMIETKLETFSSTEELATFSQLITEQIAICVQSGDNAHFFKYFETNTNQSEEKPLIRSAIVQEQPKASTKPSTVENIEWGTSEVQCLIKACNAIRGVPE